MSINNSSHRSRGAVVAIGVITGIIWFILVILSAYNYRYWSMALANPGITAQLICVLTSYAMSVLMAVGALKRIASYLLPWLAIHFVVIMVSSAWTISSVTFIFLDTKNTPWYLLYLTIATVIITVHSFMFYRVYEYYKHLISQPQQAPTCTNAGKIFKCSPNSTKPYYPVI